MDVVSLELCSSLLLLGKADASIALLSLTRSRFNMNMNGFMVITIEFEDKSKKDKYRWHDKRCLLLFVCKVKTIP